MTEALTVQDRIALLSILPAQGNITTLKIVRQLREDLSFTEDEHKQYGIVMEDSRILWDASLNGQTADVKIGLKAREVIVASLNDMDRKKKLEDGHVGIWNRFMEDAAE